MMYQSFSKRQLLAMTWWNRPGLGSLDGILCDGAIRSGKTLSMVTGFFLWSMAKFDGCCFGLCGKTIGALRRNIVGNLQTWLGDTVDIRENRSENKLVVSRDGKQNTFYLFGGQDESAYKLIQGITLAGVLLDEAALMPRSFVEQACARCSVAGSKLWFNCNPEGPEHWLYKEWIQKAKEKRLLHLHFTMEDNPGLDPAIRQRYEAMYTGAFYRRHKAVLPVQKYLYALGYTEVGEADGVAGKQFAAAVKAFQKDNACTADGEITARNKTWRKLLGME